MKRFVAILALLCIMVSVPTAYAGAPKYRASTYARIHGAARHSSASRPYYGGGKHTTSHGGQYRGATNSHHKNGHYNNWRSGNRYGVHKPS
jgi:hypothetical protein